MLDRRTTMMALIEYTDFHVAITRYHCALKLRMPFQILNQAYLNSPQQYRLFHHRN